VDLANVSKGSKQLAETLGLRSFLALVDAFGGTSVRVHARPQPKSELAQVLGAEGYGRLQESFRGEDVLVPTLASAKRQERNAQICRDHAAGTTAAVLAGKHHLHVRTVRSILAEGKGRAHEPGSATRPPHDRSRFDVRHHQD
jgi:hypothetical protein